jgi:hypothetical protein
MRPALLLLLALPALSACGEPYETKRAPVTSGSSPPTSSTVTTPTGTSTTGKHCTSWLYFDEFDDGTTDLSTFLEFAPYDDLVLLERHQGDYTGLIVASEEYAYDSDGNMTYARIDPDGTTGYGEWSEHFAYDANGHRLLIEHDDGDDGIVDWSEETTWEGDQWTQVLTDLGNDGIVDGIWKASWDADGRYMGKTLDDFADGSIDYVDVLNYTNAAPDLDHDFEIDYGNNDSIDVVFTNWYDNDDRLTFVGWDSDANGSIERTSQYTYADITEIAAFATIDISDFIDSVWIAAYNATYEFDDDNLWESAYETQTEGADTTWWASSTWDWTCTE